MINKIRKGVDKIAAEKIVTLKVTTEGDQAALQSLIKLDQLVTRINGQKVNVSFSQGMKKAAEAVQKSVEAINANTANQTAYYALSERIRGLYNRLSQVIKFT